MCYGPFRDCDTIEGPAVTDSKVKFYFRDTGLYVIQLRASERYFATMQASLQFDIVLANPKLSLQNRTSTPSMTFQKNESYVIRFLRETSKSLSLYELYHTLK